MGQSGSQEGTGGKPSGSTDAANIGKIAARRATEAERRRTERELQKQLKEDERKVAAALAASQRAERDAKLSARSKPNPRRSDAERVEPPPAPRAVKPEQPRPKSKHGCDNSTDVDGALPPEVAAMMVNVNNETSDMSADIEALTAAALAAAGATLMLDDDDGMMVGDDDDAEVTQQQASSRSNPNHRSVKGATKSKCNNEDNDGSVSLHSSDFRDEELMAQLADIEGEVEAERQVRLEELDSAIAALKKNAVVLMKGGDKAAALEELKRAKHLEKERDALVAA